MVMTPRRVVPHRCHFYAGLTRGQVAATEQDLVGPCCASRPLGPQRTALVVNSCQRLADIRPSVRLFGTLRFADAVRVPICATKHFYFTSKVYLPTYKLQKQFLPSKPQTCSPYCLPRPTDRPTDNPR